MGNRTVRDIYADALEGKYYSLILLIEFLTEEKKVLKLSDTEDKLDYYLQDRFHKSMNGYLAEYERRRGSS